MKSLIARNVLVTDNQSPWNGKRADIRISGERIAEIAAPGELKDNNGDEIIRDVHVSPGFLDLRVYIADPGEEWKDDLGTIAASAAAGGFTSILCMPNTHPVMDHRDSVTSLLHRSAQLPVRFLAAGALTSGTKGRDLAELYDMHTAGARAFSDGYHAIQDAGELLRGLQYTLPFGGVIFSLPFEKSIAAGAEVAESETSVRMGLRGIPAIAEELMVHRDLRLLSYSPGSRLHIGPVTASLSIDVIRTSKEKSPGLSVETSAPYLFFSDEDTEQFDTHLKMFPPLRTPEDRASLQVAVIRGWIDAISSGHRPQAVEDKKVDYVEAAPGALALEAAFAAAHTVMHDKMPLADLIDRFSAGPRRVLGLPKLSVAEGAEAELTFFDPSESWTFHPGDSRSKSPNNPFVGRGLLGRVKGIVGKGRWV